ncbi:LptF/LptG family permease [Candidatus Poribacteria bacterium]|nr:LptF/LptG family permease [Candidatus Poribacteria bacterium]
MRILERYILREYLRYFLMSFAFFVALVIIVRLGDKEIGELLSGDKPVWDVVRMIIYRAPERVMQVFPAAGLLAIFFTFGRFIQTNELTAMKATGMSFYRMILPPLIATLGICILAGFFNDQIASRANRRVREIEGRKAFTRERNVIFRASEDKVCYIQNLDVEHHGMKNISIYSFNGDQLINSIFARAGKWEGERWTLLDGLERSFSNGREIESRKFDQMDTIIREDPSIFAASGMKPKELTYSELARLTRYKLRAGQPVRMERVELNHKIAYPFATFVVVLIGAPLAIWFGSAGFAAGFLITMFVNFMYWGIGIAMFEAMGQNGALPPALSCWAANLIFAAIGLALLIKVRK